MSTGGCKDSVRVENAVPSRWYGRAQPTVMEVPMRTLLRRRPSPAMVVACIALLVALSGTGIAAVAALPNNSVGTAQLKGNSVTNGKLAANAVTGPKVKNGSLQKADFAAGQLPAGKTGPAGPAGRRRPRRPGRGGGRDRRDPGSSAVHLDRLARTRRGRGLQHRRRHAELCRGGEGDLRRYRLEPRHRRS